ncbi:MAG: NeuD/PglB/VioB family sugar acetyltransferase [Bacteroidia bacterium]|nr:NeuD/PglB/VioB family sugar acetyltransferase [Bacteroidia bacterium]
MNNICFILGAGSHTRSLINLLEYNKIKIIGIIDDQFIEGNDEFINGFKLFGNLDLINPNTEIILSVGDNKKREFFFTKFYSNIYKNNIIHPRALIENYSTLGIANQLFANVIVNSNSIIGSNNILNTNCILEHETEIGNHNHISVNAVVCGRTKIGSRCFIGANSVIIDKIKICDDVIIGAGSVVLNNIIEPGTYVGNPIRKIK